MKVVFLDRDGVINNYPGDTHYVTSWREFKFIPGSIKAIKNFKDNGFKVYVLSNQAGVAKGLYSKKDLDYITKRMLICLHSEGADLDGVYYCLHKEEDNCLCRKPKTGLLKKAVSDFEKKPEICFFIGDSFRDMRAAVEFGCKSVLVLSGKEKIEKKPEWKFEPDYCFDNLLVAAQYICSHYV